MALFSLLAQLQSADNEQRNNAEQQLAEAIAADPSATTLELITTAKSHSDLAMRQISLLYLKKVVPMYWSAGFESFVGPAVSQEHKHLIRAALIELITTDRDSKIRNGGAYAVVQIAAVDYPDEWPDLLNTLYAHMTSLDRIAVLGGLSLLQDLLDDLVTEEQFFNGVGTAVISQCMKLMETSAVDAEVKTAAANLYKSCLLQLQNPEFLEDESKKPALEQHFHEIVTMLTVLLKDNTLDIHCILFRTSLCTIAYTLATEFPIELFIKPAKVAIQREVIIDMTQMAQLYSQCVVLEEGDFPNETDFETSSVLTNIVIEQYQLLGAFDDLELFAALPDEQFLQTMIVNAMIPLEYESDFIEEYDLFVTEETGVSPDFSPRNGITEFLAEMNANDVSKLFNYLVQKLETLTEWRSTEAILHIIQGLCDHAGTIMSQSSLVDILNKFLSLVENHNILLRSRAMIIIPVFLDKFEDQLASEFAKKSLLHCIRISNNDQAELFKSAFLIAFLGYRHCIDFSELDQQTQHVVFGIIAELIPTAKEDTPPLLAEALNAALTIHHVSIDAMNLLFQVAEKEPSNVELLMDVEDVLIQLLEDVNLDTYCAYLESILPKFVNIMQASKGEFSSELVLSLEALHVFVKNVPDTMPTGIFQQIEPNVTQLLQLTHDDQILQISGELYQSLIDHSEPELFDVGVVLQILSKFLNPELSDSAALNVGSLVVSVITKFSANLETFLPEILKATTDRLLQAKELATVDDLLNVLCYIINADVNNSVSFLSNFEIRKIFQVWFSNFGSVTGTDNIKNNCEALAHLYLSEIDFGFTVDGNEVVDMSSDLIITRSMRKNAQFKQVSVPFKIVRLLVHELRDQSVNAPHDDNEPDALGDNDEEGWEDMEDIRDDFDTLKSYLNTNEKSQSDSVKELLINFFREIASKNINNFEQLYANLTDAERQILTECII